MRAGRLGNFDDDGPERGPGQVVEDDDRQRPSRRSSGPGPAIARWALASTASPVSAANSYVLRNSRSVTWPSLPPQP